MYENYLVSLGPKATELLIQKLEDLKEGKAEYGQRGYVGLFRAAALMGDRRFLPLLQYFANKTEQPISGYARMALEPFEFMGQWDSPRCPFPPLP